MLIRPEVPSDFSEVYRFVKKAFASAYVKDGTEQDFVEKLRAGAGYLPDLALVAEEEGRLVGYVMLTRIFAVEGTTRFPLLLLAPLAIAEEARNRGKGAFLAEKALQRAAELGEEAVVLVGDPHFYNRLGFSELGGFGLKCNMEIPVRYVLVKELVPGILKDVHGIVEIM